MAESDPGRESAQLVVVTPWFPSSKHPFAGVFVADTVRSLGHALDGSLPPVVHVDNRLPEDCTPAAWERYGDIDVLRIPVPTPPGTSRQQMGRNQRNALVEHARDLIEGADAVHAHVGIPAGWAVAGVVRPETRLVVTEHATYLARELSHPAGRQMYREVLAGSAHVLAVGDAEARRIRRTFPEHRAKVAALGNPVRSRTLPLRPSTPGSLDRWLFVGNLIERKGVLRILESFARWHEDHPDRTTSLTFVGGGELDEKLRERAHELGIADAVRFTGPVAPEDLPPHFLAADVLVHLSTLETFGLTLVEAALTGLPVITTTSGGPEETLAEAASAGLARFVGIRPSVADVVAAARVLESSAPGADASRIKADLLERYGEEAFGARLLAVLDGGPAAPDLPDDAPTLVALANSPRAYRRMHQLALMATHAGVRLIQATDEAGERDACDPRVEVLDFSGTMSNAPWHLPERALISDLPAWLLRRVTDVGAFAAKVMGGGSREETWRRRAERVQGRHTRVARAVHDRGLYRFGYSYVDPWYSGWRWTDRIIDRMRELPVVAVAMLDTTTRPVAWRLAREFPDVRILGVPSVQDLWSMAQEDPDNQPRSA
ncbi:glycosyltransferase [Pseudactinotalea suaedae]|uniref:glycosyltransferase n=1 Tax=Pseudactinotalea suaedae TaxID=1524924 RepID=UPI0012E18315|nr:glycosyltransferase [Pseudactinotalea suaedae]